MPQRCREEIIMNRDRLPDRRRCEIQTIWNNNHKYMISVGRYDDGRPAEVFIDSSRPCSESVTLADDAAIVASIALQYGVPLDVLRCAISKNPDGSAATIFGASLDLLAASPAPSLIEAAE